MRSGIISQTLKSPIKKSKRKIQFCLKTILNSKPWKKISKIGKREDKSNRE